MFNVLLKNSQWARISDPLAMGLTTGRRRYTKIQIERPHLQQFRFRFHHSRGRNGDTQRFQEKRKIRLGSRLDLLKF